MSGRIVTDSDALPLLIIQFSDEAGPITDEMYQRFFDGQRELLQRGAHFATVADIHMSTPATPKQRRMLGEWLKETEPAMKVWSVGLAIVVRSSVIRGGLRAVFWIKEPAVPTKIVASLSEGVDYCFAQLAASHVSGLDGARQKWAARHAKG
jgi:hypothetical protein